MLTIVHKTVGWAWWFTGSKDGPNFQCLGTSAW
jgi:hypothetical protein